MIKYIYKITNINNSKVYIGQTTSPELRWHYHINYLTSQQKFDNPLYKDMRKYGVNTFKMEIIENFDEVSPQETIDRETYWINYYDSFNNGYNRRLGGGGSAKRFNHGEIAQALLKGISYSEVAKQFGCSKTTVLKIRDEYNIPAPEPIIIPKPAKPVKSEPPRRIDMLDKDGFLQNSFASAEIAAQQFYKTKSRAIQAAKKIIEACENKDTIVYDHKWRYKD